MAVSADTARRLALIRLLLVRAQNEADSVAPFSADSVNRLHDVTEMFLALAVQEHGLRIPRDFMDYWSVLPAALGRPLLYNAQMQKFNKMRVDLKHYGVEPAATEISSGRTAVVGLLNDECKPLFGVDLTDVSLSAFVSCVDARNLIDSSERSWEAGDIEEAFADLAEAFEKIIRDYESRKVYAYGQSIFDAMPDMTFRSPFFRGVKGEERRYQETILNAIEKLDFTVMLVGFGVDLRRYGKFKVLCPSPYYTADGQRHISRQELFPRTAKDFEFCRDFVLRTAVHLAEFDYDFDFDEARRAKRSTETPTT